MSYFVAEFNDFRNVLTDAVTEFERYSKSILNFIALDRIPTRDQIYHYSFEEQVEMKYLGITDDDVYSTLCRGELRLIIAKNLKKPIVSLDYSIAPNSASLSKSRYCNTYRTLFINYDLLKNDEDPLYNSFIFTYIYLISSSFLINRLINTFGDIDFGWAETSCSIEDNEFIFKSIYVPKTISGIKFSIDFKIAKWLCTTSVLKIVKEEDDFIINIDNNQEVEQDFITNATFTDLAQDSNKKVNLVYKLYKEIESKEEGKGDEEDC